MVKICALLLAGEKRAEGMCPHYNQHRSAPGCRVGSLVSFLLTHYERVQVPSYKDVGLLRDKVRIGHVTLTRIT